MRVSGNILVECDIPNDYGISRVMEHKGLPFLSGDLFYVITKDRRIIIREYQEDGFSTVDKPFMDTCQFEIRGYAPGGMGKWIITLRVITDSGKVKNIYELNVGLEDRS